MRTILDLVCGPPFECRATLLSSRAESEIIEDVEALFGGRIRRDELDQLTAQFIEPLELVAAARHFAIRAKNAAALRAFAATSGALELLRDPSEPTHTSWRWVLEALSLELPDTVDRFVAAANLGYRELSPEAPFLERPILAMRTTHDVWPRTSATSELVDRDEVTGNRYLELHRTADAWYVREIRNGELRVNGVTVTSPHRLATGDQLRTRGWHHDVIAIL